MKTRSSPPMFPAIHVHVAGEDAPAKFAQPFRIGRATDNDLVVQNPSVSEEHAEVWFENGQWWIKDLASTNGTLIGGRRIDRTPIASSLRVRLGHDGPALTLSLEGAAHHERPTLSDTSESQIVTRYLSEDEPEHMSRRTELVRRVFRKEQERRSQKYVLVLLVLFLVAIGAGAYAFIQRQAIQRQQAAAAELFYAMKALELDVARLQLSRAERESYRDRQADMQKRYQSFLEELGIYGSGTPEAEQLIYRVVHRFGESEVNVPKEFVKEIRDYIDRWRRSSPRLENAVARAQEHGYGPRIAGIMLDHGMPPEFFFLALQESGFKIDAVGPRTRFGIAKGMWQIIPGTAREYGLKTGPLVGVRRYDPRDDRHNFEKSTQAAAEYLRDIYTTDAQASGLLVVASYNWGQTRLLRLLRTLPETPEARNFWQLLLRYRQRIPQETYDYVFKIVSAAVIAENPSLFGFEFEPPLSRAVETAEAGATGP